MSLKAPYIFRTPRRLNQAKSDLYDWLNRNGWPASGAGPRPEEFDPESPIPTALDALPDRDERKGRREDSFDYLRHSIYASELEHGDGDHFDDRLSVFRALARSREDASNTEPEHDASRPAGNTKGRSTFVRATRLVFLASLILVGVAALSFWREACVAEARLADAVQAHREAVAALSVSLPSHYAVCYSAPRTVGCATGAPVSESARADLARAIAATGGIALAFASSRNVALHPAPLLTATSLNQCGSVASEATRADHVLHALCLGRARLIEHLNCAEGKEPGTGMACHDMARLGIAGTRLEPEDARDLPRPVNVFSMPLELSEELARLAALADTLAVADEPGFSEIADTFWARFLSFRPISGACEWIERS